MSQEPAFSKLAVTRLAHRAGVKTLGKQVHEEMCTAAATFLESAIQRALQVIEADRRVTILEADVTAVQDTEAPDLSIPRAPFKRLLQTLTTKLKPRTRWAAAAIPLIQAHTETYLCRLFEDASLCAAHADRETLMPKDVRLVLQLRSSV
jgi:histone H3/H4